MRSASIAIVTIYFGHMQSLVELQCTLKKPNGPVLAVYQKQCPTD